MIRAIKRSAAEITQRIGLPDVYALAKSNVMKSQAAIMLYHRISDKKDKWSLETMRPVAFEAHMRYFCKNYEMLSLGSLLKCAQEGEPLPKGALAITIDDGYKDNYVCAYPILRKYSVPATIFLATAHIGTGTLFWWDKVRYVIWHTEVPRFDLDELGAHYLESPTHRSQVASVIVRSLQNLPEERKNLLIDRLIDVCRVEIPHDLGSQLTLSWEDVTEMSENGVDFGAHSVSHPVLTNISREQVRYEIRQSKQDIEKRIGKRIDFFSYPNGYFDAEVARMVEETGFKGAVTCAASWIGRKTNPFMLGRIEATEDFAELRLKLCGVWGDVRSILNGRRQ
jgi:peptidoglycan/xylan/chitin deacetylase (PgdA/CDA1 family)